MSITTDRVTSCSIIICAMWSCICGYIVQYTNHPLNGFFCPDGQLQNITGIGQQQCTRLCLLDQSCRVMSYNTKDCMCMLGDTLCDVAVRHPDYLLMVFRSKETVDCIIWKHKSVPLPSRTLYTYSTIYQIALCGKQVGPDFLIGQGRADHYSYFGVRSTGGQNYGWNASVVTVNPVCTMAWIPFVAGSTLPRTALACGYLAVVGPTYCARIITAEDGELTFGYYVEADEVAYYAWGGASRATKMDILIRV